MSLVLLNQLNVFGVTAGICIQMLLWFKVGRSSLFGEPNAKIVKLHHFPCVLLNGE